ncbi:NAD(P)-binding domain-containing protein [Kitasatospora sp. NBC_01250]|uniref:ketopantoate reductase family protein n=1 Tax=Kitasatospora sp. NBC_01250 TaxID=2903571 RepID=UPI002E3466D1|nr:2-dehydropantoate 2-reductase N-terminal domain-containing protein [Kitasatospora sp. NBC_01250]
MRYIIIGAGAIGGTIGGRLYESGHQVVLVARGSQYQALHEQGLALTTPDLGTRVLPVPVAQGPQGVELAPEDVLVLAVKTQDTEAALVAWADRPVAGGGTAGERLPLVIAQNGVENERLALRRFARVYGMCVLLPASYLAAGSITAPCTPYTGMLTLGHYPPRAEADGTLRAIGEDLVKAGFLAPLAPDVMYWKYGKLVTNLVTTVEALCGTGGDPAAQRVAREAVAEADRVLDAAGIARADAAEMADMRTGKVEKPPVSGAATGGSSWQSLARGTGSIEADHLNGEMVLLGRLHGVPVPVNEALQRLANASARERRAPGSLTGEELAAAVGLV